MKRSILAVLALSLAYPVYAGDKQGTSTEPSEGTVASDAAPAPAPAPQAAAPAEDPDHPATIHFKGITITPGGFVAAETIYRAHNENSDIASSYSGVPFDGSANSNLSEFRETARQTRLSLLFQSKVGTWSGDAYIEGDFLSATPTSNEVESNSFVFRQRSLFGEVTNNAGFTFMGGQGFSLLTLNRSGMNPLPKNLFIPLTIDGQYVVGYNWARQSGIRLVGEINHKVWLGLAFENPEETVSAINPPSGIFGLNTSSNATSPNSLFVLNNTPGANGISTDAAPDIIGKIAIEPTKDIHIEVKGVASFFRDRLNGANLNKTGGGGGAGLIVNLGPKAKLVAEGLVGQGIGRYASGQGVDLTIDPSGNPVPIKTQHAMGGIEIYPDPKVDIYIYGGYEHFDQSAFLNSTGKPVGYGSPLIDNSGCGVESPSSTQLCQAQTKELYQFQPGFWYRFAQGPSGRFQMGASYSYTQRQAWAGANGIAPKGTNNMVMLSFRWYLP
jgi:hypothetical protein